RPEVTSVDRRSGRRESQVAGPQAAEVGGDDRDERRHHRDGAGGGPELRAPPRGGAATDQDGGHQGGGGASGGGQRHRDLADLQGGGGCVATAGTRSCASVGASVALPLLGADGDADLVQPERAGGDRAGDEL